MKKTFKVHKCCCDSVQKELKSLRTQYYIDENSSTKVSYNHGTFVTRCKKCKAVWEIRNIFIPLFKIKNKSVREDKK